jgi:PBP1b-binding outer membrane lipoprotein LpoB
MIPEPEQTIASPREKGQNDQSSLRSTSWRLADGCVLAMVDGEAVLLTPSMTYLKLDCIGELIVSSLINKIKMEDISKIIVSQYAVDKSEVDQDLEIFLNHLRDYGAVS